jgi:hypothetical protein
MQRKWLFVIPISLAALAVWGVLAIQGSPRAHPEPVITPTPLGALQRRSEVSPTVEAPSTSSIDNPSPTCYRPVENTGACYIT